MVWSPDSMLDAPACGRPFRIFNFIDEPTARSAHRVRYEHHFGPAVRIVERIARERPLSQALRTNNGPEFWGAFVQWAKAHGMAIQNTQPGKPN